MKTNKMHRIVPILLVVCLFLTVCLSGCGSKLKGTYKSTGLLGDTVTFDGDRVEGSILGVKISGTYKIEKNKMIMSYGILGTVTEVEYTFSKSGKSIFLNGTEYIKQ